MAMDRKKRHSWVVGALILAAGGLALAALLLLRPEPEEQPPPPSRPLVTVEEAVVVTDERVVVEGNGLVQARVEVTLSTQVPGLVERVAPSLVSGGTFTAGQPLVQLDRTDYVNRIQQAEAEVAQREVQVLQAQQEVEFARRSIARIEELEAAEVPSPDTPAGALVANLPQLRAAEAALAGARANLATARADLGRTTVTAPFRGRVRSLGVGEGAYVSPGQALAVVYPADELEVPVQLAPAQAALVPGLFAVDAEAERTGIDATVIDEIAGETYRWSGYVDRAEAALDPEARTVTAVVRVPDPYVDPSRPPLLIGAYVTVRIEGRRLGRFVVVPREAVRQDEEQAFVWLVDDADRLVVVPVEVVQTVGEQAWIVGDVPHGVPVVTSDLDQPVPGMELRVADEAPTGARPTGDGGADAGPGTGAQVPGAL